jgi:hypothetical protein
VSKHFEIKFYICRKLYNDRSSVITRPRSRPFLYTSHVCDNNSLSHLLRNTYYKRRQDNKNIFSNLSKILFQLFFSFFMSFLLVAYPRLNLNLIFPSRNDNCKSKLSLICPILYNFIDCFNTFLGHPFKDNYRPIKKDLCELQSKPLQLRIAFALELLIL